MSNAVFLLLGLLVLGLLGAALWATRSSRSHGGAEPVLPLPDAEPPDRLADPDADLIEKLRHHPYSRRARWAGATLEQPPH